MILVSFSTIPCDYYHTWSYLIKLMINNDTGSFMCRNFWRHLKVKPHHAFAYFLEAAN